MVYQVSLNKSYFHRSRFFCNLDSVKPIDYVPTFPILFILCFFISCSQEPLEEKQVQPVAETNRVDFTALLDDEVWIPEVDLSGPIGSYIIYNEANGQLFVRANRFAAQEEQDFGKSNNERIPVCLHPWQLFIRSRSNLFRRRSYMWFSLYAGRRFRYAEN